MSDRINEWSKTQTLTSGKLNSQHLIRTLQSGGVHGVSSAGIRQFSTGEPVADASDRATLARLLVGALDLIAREKGPAAIGLLLPAVQKVRS